jgi:hypothetical protein
VVVDADDDSPAEIADKVVDGWKNVRSAE